MSKPVKAAQSIVKPSMKFDDGKEHIMETFFKGKSNNLITLTSIGYVRIPDTNTFVAYKITSKGTEVLSIEVEEPNMRGIAEESSKIAFVSAFMSKDE